jgi:hypothetical protein
MAAVERWNDDGIDKLNTLVQDLQLNTGIAHAVQNAQNIEIAKEIAALRTDVNKMREETSGRQVSWPQILTFAGLVIGPMLLALNGRIG